MSTITTTAELRLAQVLEEARGADGTLGSWAQANALPAKYLRRSHAPLDDPRIESAVFDRAYHLRWVQGADPVLPQSAYDPTVFEAHLVQLTLGYLYGPGAADDLFLLRGSETANYCRSNAPARAAYDEARVRQALAHPAIYQVSSDDPLLMMIAPQGPGVTVDLMGGRLTRQLVLRVQLQRQNAPYPP